MKKYYLYIDESGDHGLVNLDTNFPVFLLCGVLVSDENYNIIRSAINVVKRDFGGVKK
ncbi:DUF3800 domain-containing protein [Chryseobacterium koreense]|uniref:DUF3800 domain-containing protein n=1 Tax=Chryseobacterium koreense TaxID=232216 RepID=UPI0034E96AD0